MKFSLMLFSFLFLQTAMAAIPGSNYELRHQDIIVNALEKDCGRFEDLQQISSQEVEIRIDQGIKDVKFTTVLHGDSYTITVESYLSDSYDHAAREWGIYSVDRVKCELE